ncbi:MAG: hypothetical protein ABIF92_00250 [archaeon]
MMKKQYALILMAVIVMIAAVSAVYARTTNEDEACIPKPTGAFSLAMVTESAMYLFSGGLGPILIIALVAILAAIISHLIWGGF